MGAKINKYFVTDKEDNNANDAHHRNREVPVIILVPISGTNSVFLGRIVSFKFFHNDPSRNPSSLYFVEWNDDIMACGPKRAGCFIHQFNPGLPD